MNFSLQRALVRARNRFLYRSRRAQFEHELAEELEFHTLQKQAENARAGLDNQSARELSRRQMGNITLAQEDSREAWTLMTLERLLQDLRYALRMFGRTPVFTTVAALSLALGIGGNAAMFSLVDALLIRALPYPEPERLVRITGIYPRAAIPFFRGRSHDMDIASVSASSEFNLTGHGIASRVRGSKASSNFLSVLGVSVARGRSFRPEEEVPLRDGVVIISSHLWQKSFGADPSILGHLITLNGITREVIGIMPEGFSYPSADAQLWVPMRLDASNFLEYWGTEFMPILGRLRPKATSLDAQNEVRALIAQFRKTFPYPMARDWNADSIPIPLQQDIVGDIRGKLVILLSSVGIVLLIACANVASLLLSRATTRRREIALRAALGAGRARIIRQLLTESLFLALLGAALGLVVGTSLLSIFKSVLPPSTPGLAQAAIDWHVVMPVTALALFTGLGFGLAPALSASHFDLTEVMKTGSQRSTGNFWSRFRSFMIAAEVALTLVLVVSAGLLLKSLYKISETYPGFNPARIVTVQISPNQIRCKQRDACVTLYNRLMETSRDISGVQSSAVTNAVPLQGELPTIPVDVEGHPKTSDHPAPMLAFSSVSPEYFRIMGIPVLAGRCINSADSEHSAGVVIISAATVKHFWPRESAIGKHIKPTESQQWSTVVGVVGDVRQYSLSKALPDWIEGSLYVPYSQSIAEDGQIPASMSLLTKVSSDSPQLRQQLQQLAEEQDPNIPVGRLRPLDDILGDSIANFRSVMRIFLSFAATAILLAAIGIYGLMSYWVSQRTYEIGLRVAIGASRRRIVLMIFSQGLRVAIYGVVAGIVTSLVLTRFLAGMLYGVVATDSSTFAAVTVLVVAVAILATSFPAWRASRIDPVKSLRAE